MPRLFRYYLWVGLVFSLHLSTFAHANDKGFIKTADGVIVFPSANYTGNTREVRLQVISDDIIRVMASPGKVVPGLLGFMTVARAASTVDWEMEEESDAIVLTTAKLVVKVSKDKGFIQFMDRQGNIIAAEQKVNSRVFKPEVYGGQPSWKIKQDFALSPGEAIYGLGQHQDGIFNYRDQQVFFFQNNTEVAIPFMVSSKHYGILWDNYSITKAGDTREYQAINALQLYSSRGENGWLTAKYANDKRHPENIILEQAVSNIPFEFLGDSKKYLPETFDIANGLINYEGEIASEFSGDHKFKFTYAGYVKVWIDGELLLDRWRQAWNPGTAVLNIPMEKGRKYKFRMEWIPDGGESYLTMKWLNPLPGKNENTFSFDSEAGQQLDYYFVYGRNLDEVIAGYRKLTGKAPIVPRWALGKWQSRERYKTGAEILETVQKFREKGIPLDNIVLDWSYWKEDQWGSQEFDAERFPDPGAMIRKLHDVYHTHFMISVWPKFYEGIPAYQKFADSGWLYKRNIADRQRDWIGKGYVSTFYDAFNKDARKAFWDLVYKNIGSLGVDAWWMDASEPDILSNVSPGKRKEQIGLTAAGIAAETLNAYPLENAKGIYDNARATHPDQRVFLLTRSGYGGSQRYGATIWSGDIASRWFDMKAQIAAGLNFSLSGLPYWSMDIGGFSVEKRYEHAKGEDLNEWRELNTRWYQFGAFCPVFRVHGQFPYREIYNIAPDGHPAYESMLYYDRLRYRLLPYIYSLAGSTYFDDYTPMRALIMDFGADEKVKNIGDEYMFGNSLLINPVYTYKARERDVYLPGTAGWYDLYSGKYYEGGQQIKAAAPYERMPIFVKAGSILPMGPDLQYTDEKPADTVTLFVYMGADADFVLYEDEGSNYNYEKGAYSQVPIHYDAGKRSLVIGDRKGSFKGMLKKRQFKVVWVNPSKPQAFDPSAAAATTKIYRGKKILIQYP